MDEPKRSGADTTGGQPEFVGAEGSSIHYGPTWNPEAEEKKADGDETIAVLVCHGMGQQVRYETISAVANAIRIEANGTNEKLEVHISKENESFLARAELSWKKEGKNYCVHVYEAYWAPLTEGKVTYWDTISFLFGAAWNTSRYTFRGKFLRWMFGGRQPLRLGRWGLPLLAGVMTVLLTQVALGIYVSLALVQTYQQLMKATLPVGVSFLNREGWLQWWSTQKVFTGGASHIARDAVVWFALVAVVYFFRYFVVQFVGDVAAYVSPYKDSKFDKLRQKIQKVGLDVGKVVYGFGGPIVERATQGGENFHIPPQYKKIIMVGHSLGSVLAYDTLNALINLDNVSGPDEQRRVIKRTRALVTFGSPLDKTAFIFRTQAKSDQDWIREQIANSMQPLIVSYPHFRPFSFCWVNLWSPADIISGALDYYDAVKLPESKGRTVRNIIDKRAWIPLAAHVQYWNNPLLRQQLHYFVTNPDSEGCFEPEDKTPEGKKAAQPRAILNRGPKER